MKNKFGYAILVILIVFFGLARIFDERAAAKDRAAWEYKTVWATAAHQDSVIGFNKLGDEGWELVAIENAPERLEPNYYVFKRLK